MHLDRQWWDRLVDNEFRWHHKSVLRECHSQQLPSPACSMAIQVGRVYNSLTFCAFVMRHESFFETCLTRSPAVTRIADHTVSQWPSKSSKVDDFHFIWKGVCHFPLVINSNFGCISPFPRYSQFSIIAHFSYFLYSTPNLKMFPWH